MSELRTAAIFCRGSTRDQGELSLDSQELAVRRVLTKQGFHCPPHYVVKVDWTSLDLMSCPQFQELRRWIATGEVATVGVLDRDRLQTQGLQTVGVLSRVPGTWSAGDRRSESAYAGGSRDGLRDRGRLKGLPPNWQSPYGMKWQDQRLVPDDNYPVACDIWRMALEGETLRSIAKKLTQQGVPTARGGRVWSATTIGSILANRSYAGVVEALKTEAVTPAARRRATYGKTSTRARPNEQRVPLEGLVVQPVVTQEEFEWVQQRRKHNQQYAAKNTKLREYLLKGRIRCGLCGRVYTGVTRGNRSYHYCRGRVKLDWGANKCPAQKFQADPLEQTVYHSVTRFLTTPEVFLGEVHRRRQLEEQTAATLKEEMGQLERQARQEREAEAQAFRLASRYHLSEDVFRQELDVIRSRRQGIEERRRRVLSQLEMLDQGFPTAEAMEALQQRLGSVLSSEASRDRSLIFDALGVSVIAHGDGSWDLELEVPREVAPTVQDVQIENTGPRLGWGAYGFSRLRLYYLTSQLNSYIAANGARTMFPRTLDPSLRSGGHFEISPRQFSLLLLSALFCGVFGHRPLYGRVQAEATGCAAGHGLSITTQHIQSPYRQMPVGEGS